MVNDLGSAYDKNYNSISGGMTAWWRMGDNNGGTGTTLSDAIGSADATLINDTTYVEDVPT